MKDLLVPFALTFIGNFIIFFYIFCIIDSTLKRQVALKFIFVYLILAAIIHTIMSISYTLMCFKGYFVFFFIMFLPVAFYRGENCAKRVGCGLIICIFLILMDCVTGLIYFSLTSSDITVIFSVERQIYYDIIGLTLYPLSIKPVRNIIYRFIHQSTIFYYQNILVIILIVFETGATNYMMALDTKEMLSHVIDSAEYLRYMAVIFAFFLLNTLSIYALNRLDKSYRVEREIRLNKQKTEIQRSYYKLVEEHYQQGREIAHDLKNHILTIEHLYEAEENEAAASYSDTALAHMEKIIFEKECKNKKLVSRSEGEK